MDHEPGTTFLMAAYECMAGSSRSLLAAARAADWDAFDRIQAQMRAFVADERQHPARHFALTAQQAARRRRILAALLEEDREIRDLVDPGTARTESRLGLRR